MNPLANPKSSDRDALMDLEHHPGFQLFLARLRDDLEGGREMLADAVGLQEVGRYQGAVKIGYHVLHLREQLLQEIEEELNPTEQSSDAARKAFDVFFGSAFFDGTKQ